MFNKKYKKGMADAAKAYETFGQKQEKAIETVLEEVRQGNTTISDAVQSLKGNVDNLYSYLKSKEKADLYTVYTPFDIKNLDENERLFLVGALLRLTIDKTPTDEQQNYLRSIQKYLEIKEPPFGVDLTAIENIENVNVQKAIYQSVLEYLILQDGDSYDETELQQEFLDCFNLNPKNRASIAEHVEILYSATGAIGLAEKYGYVGEKEENNSRHNYLNLVIELLNDKSLNDHNAPIETEDYIVVFKSFFSKDDAEILIISKEQGKVIKTFYGGKFYHCFSVYSHKNSICLYNDKNIYIFDIDANATYTILKDFNDFIIDITYIDERHIIFNDTGDGSYILDCNNKMYDKLSCRKCSLSRIVNENVIYSNYSVIKKYNIISRSEDVFFDFNKEITDFEIYENNVFVLLREELLGNFWRFSIACFSLDNPKNIFYIENNLLICFDEMPFLFYPKRKQYNKGWLFVSEPNKNLIKFRFDNKTSKELLSKCKKTPDDLIVLRDYVFYENDENKFEYIQI